MERKIIRHSSEIVGQRSMAAAMATLELEYVIRGYHDYMRVWIPVVGEQLSTEIEPANPHNRYAVAVVSHEHGTVGHVPKKIRITSLPLFLSQRWC